MHSPKKSAKVPRVCESASCGASEECAGANPHIIIKKSPRATPCTDNRQMFCRWLRIYLIVYADGFTKKEACTVG